MSYKQIDASWDSKLIKRRSTPQSVTITTPDLFTKYYPLPINMDWDKYYSDRDAFYNRIPSPLSGKLLYRIPPYDYMGRSFFRPGMIACINEKVLDIFRRLKVNREEYCVKPIVIDGVTESYYILFFPFISHLCDSGILWSDSIFRDRYTKECFVFNNREEYCLRKASDKSFESVKIVLPGHYKKRDILSFAFSSVQDLVSDRLVDAFGQEGIVGVTFNNMGTTFVPEVMFDD